MTQNERLANTLHQLIKESNLKDLSNVIDYLLDIEKFKCNLNTIDDTQSKFDAIAEQLKKQFNIQNLKITQKIADVGKIAYYTKHENDKGFENVFDLALNNKGEIKVELNSDHLNQLEKIKLDSFLNEILTSLYLTVVIDEIQETSLIDPLTGLKNRLAFNEEMNHLIPLALREKMKIGVLLFNIDRFRAVNDEHGTAFGDLLLKHYANILSSAIRTSDIAIRFGGGEFLVLLLNIKNSEKALEVAAQIQQKLNESFVITPYGDNFHKTVSVGISMFPEDTRDIFEAIHFANNAVADAKDKGRSQILQYTTEEDGELDLF